MEQVLANFLRSLFGTGEVAVKGVLCDFSESDKINSTEILRDIYGRSVLEVSSTPPEFNSEAALWGAATLYKIIQFTMIRSLEAGEIKKQITLYEGEHSASAIYSSDLCLRYLPDILTLAKGLAPDDPLIAKIKLLAEQWPFSSVGIKIENEADDSQLMGNRSLLMSYVDRIIEKKDLGRIKNEIIKEHVEAVLGNYSENLWPGYTLLKLNN